MIILKSREEIEKMRASSRIVAEILQGLKEMVKPGVRTIDLDRYAEEQALRRGAKPAFKGYRGYEHALCTSVNNVVVHGIPSARVLEAGDILSLDFGVYYDGFYGDAALTVPVDGVSENAARLDWKVSGRGAVPGDRAGAGRQPARGYRGGHPAACRGRRVFRRCGIMWAMG